MTEHKDSDTAKLSVPVSPVESAELINSLSGLEGLRCVARRMAFQLDQLRSTNKLSSDGVFPNPHVTIGACEISLEWWKDNRKLTLYVGNGPTTYLRAWGTNIHEDMDNGEVGRTRSLIWLLAWLMDG